MDDTFISTLSYLRTTESEGQVEEEAKEESVE